MRLVTVGVVISVLMVFDIILTEYGVSRGIGELNPMARTLIEYGLHAHAKLLIALTILLGLFRIQRRLGDYLSNPTGRKLIACLYVCSLAALGVYAFALFNNLMVLTYG